MNSSRTRIVLALAVVAMAALVLTAGTANAAPINLLFDNFEGMAGTSITLSNWDDVTNRYIPLYVPGGSAATPGNVLADQTGSDGLGGNAGKAIRVRSSTGSMVLKAPLQLATLGATSVTISFDLKEHTNPYISLVQYSALGDFTDAVTLATFNGSGVTSPETWVHYSYTVTSGLTDTAQFRIGMPSRGTGANGTYHIWDNISIDYVPEPATMGLLALGGLALLRRRRRA